MLIPELTMKLAKQKAINDKVIVIVAKYKSTYIIANMGHTFDVKVDIIATVNRNGEVEYYNQENK